MSFVWYFSTLSKFSRFLSVQITCKNVVLRSLTSFSMKKSFLPSPLQLVRWKSKGHSKQKFINISREDLPRDLLGFMKEEEMNKSFQNVINRFKHNLRQCLAFKLSPELFSELMVPDANVRLGQIAHLKMLHQNPSHSNNNATYCGDQILLVDLSSKPNLVNAARKAVSSFLDPNKDGSSSSRIQYAGPAAFTIKLNTLITKENQQKMIERSKDALNHTIHDLDKVYQFHDKIIHMNPDAKKFSEDSLFKVREYLRQSVKQKHDLVNSIWQDKLNELSIN